MNENTQEEVVTTSPTVEESTIPAEAQVTLSETVDNNAPVASVENTDVSVEGTEEVVAEEVSSEDATETVEGTDEIVG